MCKKLKLLHVEFAKCKLSSKFSDEDKIVSLLLSVIFRFSQFQAMEQNEPASKRIKLDQDGVERVGPNGLGMESEIKREGGVGSGTFIRERDVGITQYINNTTSGLFGIIKQRLFMTYEV